MIPLEPEDEKNETITVNNVEKQLTINITQTDSDFNSTKQLNNQVIKQTDDRPEVTVKSFNEIGQLKLLFNQEMIVPGFLLDVDLRSLSEESSFELSKHVSCSLSQTSDGHVPIGDYKMVLQEFTATELVI